MGDDLGVGLNGVPGTNNAYDTGLLICRALSCAGGFVIWIMFRTYYVLPEIWLASLIGQLRLLLDHAD